MLKDKILLEDFNLVEELDNRAAAAMVGGTVDCSKLPEGSGCLDIKILCPLGNPDSHPICISTTEAVPGDCKFSHQEDGIPVYDCWRGIPEWIT